MARSASVPDERRVHRHAVVLLVGTVDRRLLPALRFVARLPRADVRALHVSVDADQARRLAADWMRLGLTWIPLDIQDATNESLAEAVGRVVEGRAAGTGDMTVVVPELEPTQWWHRLLHRGSARQIVRRLGAVPRVTIVVVPFAADGRR